MGLKMNSGVFVPENHDFLTGRVFAAEMTGNDLINAFPCVLKTHIGKAKLYYCLF